MRLRPPSLAQGTSRLSRSRWLWPVRVAGLLLLAGVASWVLTNSHRQDNLPPKPGAQQAFTIGSTPYVYPCSIATGPSFKQIFGLDNGDHIGGQTETTALASASAGQESDLIKAAPTSSKTARYNSDCMLTMAKKGATRSTSIDAKVSQFSNRADAETSLKNLRMSASRDYTFDDIDNGSRSLGTLPSFEASSFVQLPEPSDVSKYLKAAFWEDTILVELSYGLEARETPESITPKLDAFAATIKQNLHRQGLATKPTDLTGHPTFVGKKLVDLCRRTDLGRLSQIFGSLEYRPDSATSINVYGSLAGSQAAADGALSSCKLAFNTPGDRTTQAGSASNKNRPLTAPDRYLHNLTLTTNTYAAPADAKAAWAAKKQRATQPFGGSSPTISEVKDVEDAAYKYHKETPQANLTLIEDSYAVAAGSNLITVNLQQTKRRGAYTTEPIAITDKQLASAIKLIQATLAKNRSH